MSRLERIVASVGGVVFEGGRRALIPGPGHSAHDRSVSLLIGADGRLIVHCFSPKDDWRAVRAALKARGLLDDAPVEAGETPRVARRVGSGTAGIIVQPTQDERVARARRLWSESLPIAGTLAERYLRLRGITRDATASDSLRFHPRMTSLDDRLRRPALVAALCDPNGVVQGVEVTLLSTHGSANAPVATPRRVIGTLIGGAVQLDIVDETLLVAEGVATTLSAAQVFDLPAWALLTAYNLACFTPPARVRRLVVAADRDKAGLQAASALAERVDPLLEVEIAPPPAGFGDWNDFIRAG